MSTRPIPLLRRRNRESSRQRPSTLGLSLHVLNASTDRDFDAVFARLAQLRAGALVIGVDAFFNSHSAQLAALATRHAVPTISAYQEFTAAGGLMSYGGSIVAASHQAGIYAGRILNGEKPADLPVMQSTKVSLTINLKTAKTLGLECRSLYKPGPTR